MDGQWPSSINVCSLCDQNGHRANGCQPYYNKMPSREVARYVFRRAQKHAVRGLKFDIDRLQEYLQKVQDDIPLIREDPDEPLGANDEM